MKQITVSDQTDSRLVELAGPNDSHDSVIARLLDAFARGHSAPGVQRAEPQQALQERGFGAFDHPSLTHTKITAATVEGDVLVSPNWNGLLDEMLRIAKRRLGAIEPVRKLTTVNLFNGKKVNEGYHYLPDCGFSVQGQDANDAWRAVAQIATRLGIAVEVHFFWRHKDGAAFPGEFGVFRVESGREVQNGGRP